MTHYAGARLAMVTMPYAQHACSTLHVVSFLLQDLVSLDARTLQVPLPSMTEAQAQRQRQKNYRLLARLAPGRGGALRAVRDHHGQVATAPADIASAFRGHWSKVFRRRPIDRSTLLRWVAEEPGFAQSLGSAAGEATNWRVTRADFRRAMALTGKSAPGPDGIPFAAWRRLER